MWLPVNDSTFKHSFSHSEEKNSFIGLQSLPWTDWRTRTHPRTKRGTVFFRKLKDLVNHSYSLRSSARLCSLNTCALSLSNITVWSSSDYPHFDVLVDSKLFHIFVISSDPSTSSHKTRKPWSTSRRRCRQWNWTRRMPWTSEYNGH